MDFISNFLQNSALLTTRASLKKRSKTRIWPLVILELINSFLIGPDQFYFSLPFKFSYPQSLNDLCYLDGHNINKPIVAYWHEPTLTVYAFISGLMKEFHINPLQDGNLKWTFDVLTVTKDGVFVILSSLQHYRTIIFTYLDPKGAATTSTVCNREKTIFHDKFLETSDKDDGKVVLRNKPYQCNVFNSAIHLKALTMYTFYNPPRYTQKIEIYDLNNHTLSPKITRRYFDYDEKKNKTGMNKIQLKNITKETKKMLFHDENWIAEFTKEESENGDGKKTIDDIKTPSKLRVSRVTNRKNKAFLSYLDMIFNCYRPTVND